MTQQLLRQTYDLSQPRGRFRELSADSDQGTVEIAREVIKFAGADPVIDSSLSILKPRGTPHMVRFGDAERTVETLTLITATGGCTCQTSSFLRGPSARCPSRCIPRRADRASS